MLLGIQNYAARLVNKKRDVEIRIFYAGMNIGEYIVIVAYFEVIWCTLFLCVLFWHSRFAFRDFSTLPEDAAPESSSTTTEAPISRLRSIIASNLR